MQFKDAGYALSCGLRLKAARLALGHGSTEMAKKLGFKRTRYEAYENGSNRLSSDVLWLIYRRTRITPDWILLEDPTRLPAEIQEQVNSILAKEEDYRP